MMKYLPGILMCFLAITTLAQEPYRCGQAELRQHLMENDRDFLQREAEYEEEIRQLIRDNAQLRDEDVVITIPVVFHVLHLGGQENISNEQIYDQLAILNRDFRKLNLDLNSALPHFQNIAGDAYIEFQLPTRDPLGYCHNGIERIYTVETLRGRAESKLHPWPRSKYLNIWVATELSEHPGVAAYATKPGSAEGFNQLQDGVMIRHIFLGSIGTSSEAASGILTHEVGHFLNLSHTWGDTDDPTVQCGDDNVDDTPVTKGHWDCDRYDYECSTTPFYSSMDFSAVTVGGGTTDPTAVAAPRVIMTPGPNADTLVVGVTYLPAIAIGVSGGSMIADEFAFSDWGLGAQDGATEYTELTGAIDLDKYYGFTFTPDAGIAMQPDQVTFVVKRSADGPRSFSIRKTTNPNNNLNLIAGPGIQIVNGTVGFFMNDDPAEAISVTASLGSPAGPDDPITIRIHAWNAETSDGWFSVDDVSLNGSFGIIENVENYMEYAYCQKMFTQGQTDRMRAALHSPIGQRDGLWTTANLQNTGVAEGYRAECAPIADFYSIPGPIFANPVIPYPSLTCAGTNILFKDNSGAGTPTAWSWTFQDGQPSTSDEQNPIITFTQPGWKQVTLSVSNDAGSDMKTSPFEVYVGSEEDAMQGLSSYGFEEPLGIWPFIYRNYEDNITRWDRLEGAGHTGNACVFLNAGDRNYLDLIDPDNDRDYDDLITPILDLTGVQDASLSFWYSYSTQTANLENITEQLLIQRSLDCGRTWSNITGTGGIIAEADLVTNGNDNSPGSWRHVTYTLPNAVLTNNVRFRFRFISSTYSNHLYLDDINIGGPVGIADLTGGMSSSIRPNPANDRFTVQLTGCERLSTTVTILDARGAVVHNADYAANGPDGILMSAQTLGLSDGLYVVRLSNAERSSVQKLVVGD